MGVSVNDSGKSYKVYWGRRNKEMMDGRGWKPGFLLLEKKLHIKKKEKARMNYVALD